MPRRNPNPGAAPVFVHSDPHFDLFGRYSNSPEHVQSGSEHNALTEGALDALRYSQDLRNNPWRRYESVHEQPRPPQPWRRPITRNSTDGEVLAEALAYVARSRSPNRVVQIVPQTPLDLTRLPQVPSETVYSCVWEVRLDGAHPQVRK